MNKLILLVVSILVPFISNCQIKRPLLLNKHFQYSVNDEVVYFRMIESIEDDRFLFVDFRVKDSVLVQKGGFIVGTYNRTSGSWELSNISKLNDSTMIENHPINGVKHMLFHGNLVKYHDNGQKKLEGIYYEGKRDGVFKYWYSNGKLKSHLVFNSSSKINEFRVISHFDSLGVQQVSNGNGVYTVSEEKFNAKGMVLDGLKTGEWIGQFNNDSSHFKETYSKGILLSGKSYDSDNNEYLYDEISTPVDFDWGGMRGFYSFISSNFEYPSEAVRKGVEGTVYVEFTINEKGETVDVHTIKGIGPLCDKEAERLIEIADHFIPSKYRGQPVKGKMTQPLIFSLPRRY